MRSCHSDGLAAGAIACAGMASTGCGLRDGATQPLAACAARAGAYAIAGLVDRYRIDV
jgi:hypothetical protein